MKDNGLSADYSLLGGQIYQGESSTSHKQFYIMYTVSDVGREYLSTQGAPDSNRGGCCRTYIEPLLLGVSGWGSFCTDQGRRC